jgi:hypothetical protein
MELRAQALELRVQALELRVGALELRARALDLRLQVENVTLDSDSEDLRILPVPMDRLYVNTSMASSGLLGTHIPIPFRSEDAFYTQSEPSSNRRTFSHH